MSVWVFNQFAGSLHNSSGAGERYHFIAQRLKRDKQIDITIFAASYNHLFVNQPETNGVYTIEYIDGVRYCWVKIPKYSPESGIGRLLSWMVFMFRLFFIPRERIVSPSRIIVSSMSMFPIYPALVRKLFSRGRIEQVIFEIRDIWPLTLIEMGGFSKFNPVIILLSITEWVAYRFADKIISVLPFADQHIRTKVNREVLFTWIPNGIEVKGSIGNTAQMPLLQTIAERNRIVVTYAGAVGTANALNYFLEAHTKLKDPSKFLFLVLGTGPELAKLKQKYTNAEAFIFAGKVPKSDVHAILSQSNMLFIGWHDLPIYRFGVSANKYSDYMLAKKPIISSGNLAYDPVREAGCGVVVEAEDPDKIASAIEYLSNLAPAEQVKLSDFGYQYLLRTNSMEVLADKFFTLLTT